MVSQSIILKIMVIKIVKKVGKGVLKMDCGYGQIKKEKKLKREVIEQGKNMVYG